MPRKIGKNIINELVFVDPVTAEKVRLRYRPPTTSERAAYQGGLWLRRGGKDINNTEATRLKHGLEILVGIEDGYLQVDDGQGGVRPVITTEGADGYDPDWKRLVEEFAPEIALKLAAYVFEGGAVLPRQLLAEEDTPPKN